MSFHLINFIWNTCTTLRFTCPIVAEEVRIITSYGNPRRHAIVILTSYSNVTSVSNDNRARSYYCTCYTTIRYYTLPAHHNVDSKSVSHTASVYTLLIGPLHWPLMNYDPALLSIKDLSAICSSTKLRMHSGVVLAYRFTSGLKFVIQLILWYVIWWKGIIHIQVLCNRTY